MEMKGIGALIATGIMAGATAVFGAYTSQKEQEKHDREMEDRFRKIIKEEKEEQ